MKSGPNCAHEARRRVGQVGSRLGLDEEGRAHVFGEELREEEGERG